MKEENIKGYATELLEKPEKLNIENIGGQFGGVWEGVLKKVWGSFFACL